MGYSKAEAARRLEVSDAKYRNMERGYRHDGYEVSVPNGIGLACCTLALGLKPESRPLKEWRDSLDLSQEAAADMFGIALNTYKNYERGSRPENDEVAVPGYIFLACAAISKGIKSYDGPDIF
jgi:hypothetical protein